MADMNFGKMRQDALTVLTGDFVVRCVEVTAVKNSNGDDMLKSKLEIIAGPYAGRRIFNNFNIIPSNQAALAMFFRHMQVFGLDDTYFNKLPNGEAGVQAIARDLVGRVVTVTVGTRKFNNVDRENVEAISPAPAGLGGTGLPTSGAQPLATPLAQPIQDAAPATTTPATVTGSAEVSLPLTVGDPPVTTEDALEAPNDENAEPVLPF